MWLQEIRGVFRVCKSQLQEDKYLVIRQFIYSYADGQLSHKQLVALCEVRKKIKWPRLRYVFVHIFYSTNPIYGLLAIIELITMGWVGLPANTGIAKLP